MFDFIELIFIFDLSRNNIYSNNIFFTDFLVEIKEKKEEFAILFVSITFFLLLTIPSLKTNYEYLFIKQMSQALRSNDWWAYFGSFILGKDNLVTNTDFVNF